MQKSHITLFLLSCIPYLVSMFFYDTSNLFPLKIIPIALLIYFSLISNYSNKLWLGAALVFSAIGDIFLALSIDAHFVNGLLAFFIAHIFYSCVYLKSGINRRWNKSPLTWLITGTSVAFSLLVLPASAGSWPFVLVYICMISAMATLAANLSKPNLYVLIGALSFLTSDSIIAFNKFILELPLASLAIMLTYYGAQGLIVYGLLQDSSINQRSSASV